MDIRALSDTYSVSPQIVPEDIAAIAAAGYATVICNRPDIEVPADLSSDTLRAAAEVAGLSFVANPVVGGALSPEIVEMQREAMASSAGPVLAYCASGTRSAAVWAFAQAGSMETDKILSAARSAGYPFDGLAPQLAALAARQDG